MTEREAAEVRCLSFESRDEIEALAETVIDAHERISERFRCFNPLPNDSSEVRQSVAGRIASVINACFGTMFGQSPHERYDDDLFVQISVFCEHLAKDHIFPDGNKRTALVVSLALLNLRGIIVDGLDSEQWETNEFYCWIQEAVSGARSSRELAAALREMSRFGSYNAE